MAKQNFLRLLVPAQQNKSTKSEAYKMASFDGDLALPAPRAFHENNNVSPSEPSSPRTPSPESEPLDPMNKVHGYENVTLQSTKLQALRARRHVYENAGVLGTPLPRRCSEATTPSPDEIIPLSFERRVSSANVTEVDSEEMNPGATSGTLDIKGSNGYLTMKSFRFSTALNASQIELNMDEYQCDDDEDEYISDSDFDSDVEDAFEVNDGSSYGTPSELNIRMSLPTSELDIMMELIASEEAFVERLHFVCKVVLVNVKVLGAVPNIQCLNREAVHFIFMNIEEIYKAHAGIILPQFKRAIACSESLTRVLHKTVPYLWHYSDYIENYQRSSQYYDSYLQANVVFAGLIRQVEKLPECQKMSVKQHLSEVLHRISKYQTIYKGYTEMINLNPNEAANSKEIETCFTKLTRKLELAMSYEDRMKKLKEIQQKLDVPIVNSRRQHIRDTKIKTVIAETGRTVNRHLFLFSDLVILAAQQGLGGKCRAKRILNLDKIQVLEGENLKIPNTFFIQGQRKAIEFHLKKPEERTKWIETINRTLEEYRRWKSLDQPRNFFNEESPALCNLDDSAETTEDGTKCNSCGEGQSTRALAKWDTPSTSLKDCDDIHGSLLVTWDKGTSWKRRGFGVTSDGCLLCYLMSKTEVPFTALHLRRFRVALTSRDDPVNKAGTFKLYNSRKTFFFNSGDIASAKAWLISLAKFSAKSQHSSC